MDKFITAICATVVVVGGVILLCLALSLPVMWLWDWLMPTLFGLKEITLFQAWGLMVLCSLLFKSHTSTSK
jgi:hypothetical protein